MKAKTMYRDLCSVILMLAGSAVTCAGPPQAPLTYQGQLSQAGEVVNDTCDFIFSLWDAESGGSMVGSQIFIDGVTVSDGVFTTSLDFPPADVQVGDRWLQISVRCPTVSETYSTLVPRQAFSAVPYSLGTHGLVVDGNENVGVGTELPAARLHVGDDARIDGTLEVTQLRDPGFESDGLTHVVEMRGTTATDLWMRFRTGGSSPVGLAGTLFSYRNTSHFFVSNPGGRLSLYGSGETNEVPGAGGADELVTIELGGNVGIGTSSPQYLLDVDGTVIGRGTSDRPGVIADAAGGDGSPCLRLAIERAWVFEQGENGGDADLVLRPEVGGSGKYFRIRTQAGDPIATFQTTDNPGLRSLVLGAEGDDVDLFVWGDIAAKPGGGSWADLSDRRVKRNIQPLHDALEQLLAIEGVTFEYREPQVLGQPAGTRVGVVAQQVQRVFPEWVDESPDGTLMVTFRGFQALVVEAMRELRDEKDAEIDQLREQTDAELERLRETNERLAERLARLEAIVAGSAGN